MEGRTQDEVDRQALAMVHEAFDHARAGASEALEALLERGVPVDVRNGNGDSLLMLAAYHGHPTTTRLLLQRGANPELRNLRNQTPLQGVAFQGNLEVAELLLSHGAQVDE